MRSRQVFDCIAQRLMKMETRQPGGAIVEEWVLVGPVIAARIAPVSSSEPLVLGRHVQRNTFYLVLPWDEDMEDEGRIEVTHMTEGWTKQLSPIGRRSPRSNQVNTKLVVEEV